VAANNIGSASLVLSTSGSKLTSGLDKSAGEIKSFAGKASEHLNSIGGKISSGVGAAASGISSKLMMAMKAGPYVAAAAGLGLVIYEAIRSPFDKLKELGGLQKKADVLGISSSQLAGLTNQLKRVGIESDQVGDLFAKMGKNLYDAGGGHGKAAPALKQLGIDAKALMDLAPDEQFKKIADEISKLPPGAAQASAALHIFGNQGAALLPVLQKGGAGIQKFIEEQKKTGAVLGDSQMRAALEAQKAWKESRFAIEEAWDGLVNRATLVAAPIVKFIGGVVTKGMALLTPIFDWIGRAMERVSIILERVGEVFEKWFDEAYQEVKGLLGQVEEFTGAWPTVEEVVTGVLRTVATSIAFLWDGLKMGVGILAIVTSYLVKGFGIVVESFKDTIKALLELAGELPDSMGGKWFRDQAKHVDTLGDRIKASGDKMKDWGKGTIDSFGNGAKDVAKWFDNMDMKRKEAAGKKAKAAEEAKPAEYKALAATVKGSKEAYSIEAKFRFDSKNLGKEPADKALDEAKKANDILRKIVDKLSDGLMLKAA
jgi:hypothetical protein